MGLNKSKEIKTNSWMIALVIFSCAALSPEYVAPILSAVGAIYTIKLVGIQKRSFSSFSIGYSFLIFIAWMVVGAFYANSIISALASIFLWLFMLSGYWLCTVWIDTERKIEKIILGGAVAGGISGFIGIFQAVARAIWGKKPTTIINPFWHFLDLLIEKLVEILPEFISSNFSRTTFKLFAHRSCGTFSNPLFFATFLVAMLSFSFYCFFNSEKKSHRIIGLISALCALGGIVTSYSRAPMFVAVIVLGMLLIYGGKKALKILGIGAGGGIAVLILVNNVTTRLSTFGTGDDKSTNTRKRILAAIFEKIPDEFVFGYGTGFDSVRSILHNEYNIPQPHAHNILLEIQMENGIIGVMLFLGACLVFAYNIYKLFRKGGIARNFAITFFISFAAMCMCGMTDCIFYGLKPLQYFMLICGLTQASVNIFVKEEDLFPKLKAFVNKRFKSNKTKDNELTRV